jgi:probable F420-dependent oxidoreductase
VRFGASAFIGEDTIDAATFARAAEDAGFESIWVGEHSHIPTSERTPYGGRAGMPLPYGVPRMPDPFVVLSAAAAVTRELRLGTFVCLVAQRDTIQLAKEVASLDWLSGGRFLFGIGAGWNIEELENHGADPATRFTKLREQVDAMTEIWTKERASYRGKIVRFEELWAWPKPVQRPRPPVYLGSHGPNALRNVVRFADGWCPQYAPDEQWRRIPELQELAAEAGRGRLPVMLGQIPEDPAVIERLAAIDGVERLVFSLSTRRSADRLTVELLARDEILRRLEEVGELVAPYRDG